MDGQAIFINLRNIFIELYSHSNDAQRIVSDARINYGRINFDTAPVNFWHSILEESVRSGKIDALFDIALNEYRDNQKLRAAYGAYHWFIKQGGHIEPTEPPLSKRYKSATEVASSVHIKDVAGGIRNSNFAGRDIIYKLRNHPLLLFVTVCILIIGLFILAFGGDTIISNAFASPPTPTYTKTPSFGIANSPTENIIPSISPTITFILATNTPTLVQLLTIISTPIFSAPLQSCVTIAQVNLRKGPGTSFEVIILLDNGIKLEPIAKNLEGTWIKASVNNNIGWVSTAYINCNYTLNLPLESVPPSNAPLSGNNQIGVGMTYEEVVAILGPGNPIMTVGPMETYQWGSRFDPEITITFILGRVSMIMRR